MAKSVNVTQDELDYFKEPITNYKNDSLSLKSQEMKEPISNLRSRIDAVPRGMIEGVIESGKQFLNPASDIGKQKKALDNLLSGNFEELPSDEEIRKQAYDKYLPKNDEPISNALERGAKHFPQFAIPIGGQVSATSAAVRSGVAGALGEGAKELGFGPSVQSIAEILGLSLPDLSKKILAKGQQKELLDFARNKGMTEEEIALSLGNEGWLRNAVSNVASKKGRTEQKFKNTYESLGNIWQTLKSSPEAQKSLTPQQANQLMNELVLKLREMPSEVRDRAAHDLYDLYKSGKTGNDLINFWQDLGHYIPKGYKRLGTLKEVLKKGLNDLSPELAKDFELTNELYGNFAKFRERMSPDFTENLIKSGEVGYFLTSLLSGDLGGLSKVIGAVGGREIASELITNPRLRNLNLRIMEGIKKGSKPSVKEAYKLLVNEIAKKDVDTAIKMNEYDIDKFWDDYNNN